ncbi:MAG: ABC transporter permease [Candidatus Methanomethylicia archaeon]
MYWEIVDIVSRSIYVAGLATLTASTWSIPLGLILALRRFRGRYVLTSIFNSLIGFPTVLEGLILYLLLTRSGPLGWLNLLYTVNAIIIGQALLITPLIISFVIGAVESIDPKIKDAALTLGLSEWRANLVVISYSIRGIIASIMAGFNRAIGELGVALMLGGDIRFKTRVITTAIAFETGLGNWGFALILGFIFLLIISLITILTSIITGRIIARRVVF